MASVTIRRKYTSRGSFILSPYLKSTDSKGTLSILLRNNLISKLEIVSMLNLSNQAHLMYHLNYENCLDKYNPKVYLGTIQEIAFEWNYDGQNPTKVDSKWAAGTYQKVAV